MKMLWQGVEILRLSANSSGQKLLVLSVAGHDLGQKKVGAEGPLLQAAHDVRTYRSPGN